MDNLKKTTRDVLTIKNEINRIKILIDKREEWLSDPINRRRSTWLNVHRDTMQMIEKLSELEDELNSAINN